ncbi:hypothetical protein BH23GEM9_BH23GEM9_19660 [soil metagenome]
MADGPDVSEIMRRTVQANARLYKGWVDISLEYWRGIGEIFGVAPPPGLEGAAAAEEQDEEVGGLIVLEAETGAAARGAFLVTNDLGRNVKCVLVASAMTGPQGAAPSPKVTFDPPSLELAPGEQRVVTAMVAVDDRLIPGAAYNGTVSIRGMDGFSVPFVLRRTHSLAEAERAAQRPAAETARAGSAAGGAAGRSAGGTSGGRRAAGTGAAAGTAGGGKAARKGTATKGKGNAQAAQPRKRRGRAKE